MNNKTSQLKLVKDRLNEIGYVDNFWAIDHYILRLGAIIHILKRDGWNFKTAFGKELGKELGKDKPLWKNYYYILEDSQRRLF